MMENDIEKIISIITSGELEVNEIRAILNTSGELKANEIRAILDKNPNVVHVKISNKTSIGAFTNNIVGCCTNNITLLHFVATLGCVEVAKLLIEKGAKVNAVSGDVFKNMPIHEAASNGNKEVVELLLEYKADINSKDYYGYTPLHEASTHGCEKVVKLLLEKGADVNAVTSDYSSHRETSLHKSINNRRILKMLLDYGAHTEIEDLRDGMPLHLAVSYGEIKQIKILLKAKANVNAKNKRGDTPLHVIINECISSLSKSTCEIAELLLKNGADVHAKNENGDTPLHKAAYQRGAGVVKLLLESGANVSEKNNHGTTALEMATCDWVFNSINDKVDPKPTIKILMNADQQIPRPPEIPPHRAKRKAQKIQEDGTAPTSINRNPLCYI